MAYSRSSPSPRYTELLELYKQLHVEGDRLNDIPPENTFNGISLVPHVQTIGAVIRRFGAKSLLDYGAGKGEAYRVATPTPSDGREACGLKEIWGLDELALYDPGYAAYSELPEGPFDAVISTDVLEHCPADDIEWIVGEMMSLATKFVYMTVAIYPARKLLPTGENAHVTLESAGWWLDRIETVHQSFPSLRYFLAVIPGDGRVIMTEG